MNSNRKWWLLGMSLAPSLTGLCFVFGSNAARALNNPAWIAPLILLLAPVTFGMMTYYIDHEARSGRSFPFRLIREVLIFGSIPYGFPIWWFIYIWKSDPAPFSAIPAEGFKPKSQHKGWPLLLSLAPTVLVCLLMVDAAFYGEMGHNNVPAPDWVGWSFLLLFLYALFLAFYYMDKEARSSRTLGKRMRREFAILFLNFFAFPFCWYYYIWREPPAPPPPA